MTTFAMVAGMAPIALGIGADAEFRAPMAICVIGGLISSTLLSLLFVPAIYSLVDDLERAISRPLSRLVTSSTTPSQPAPSASSAKAQGAS